jgi:hypothetical protein
MQFAWRTREAQLLYKFLGPKRRMGVCMKAKAVSEATRSELRVFQLWRDEDQSGVSGTGQVAVGVVFPSGKVVMEWLGSHSTFGIYETLQDVERIHGHGGKTRVVFNERCNTQSSAFREAEARRTSSYAAVTGEKFLSKTS